MYQVDFEPDMAIFTDAVENVTLRLPKRSFGGLVSYEEPPACRWPDAYIEAFRHPIGTSSLRDIAHGKTSAAILVSDATRQVPASKVLPFVFEELAAGGITGSQVIIIVATGVHRPATPEEIKRIVGPESMVRVRVVNHNPFNPEELMYLGLTKRGTPVWVNRTAMNCDLRIAIGKVEPHEFAGFTGGRKSVLPGISGEETIEVNHSVEMLLDPNARPGGLGGNPIHEDMVEAARMCGLHFVVNMVVNSSLEPVGIFAGDLEESHLEAVRFVRAHCEMPISSSPDIIVTTPGPPLNMDLYQSVKPLIATAPIMGEGGILVLYSSCHDGVGSEDMLRPFVGAQSPDEVIANLRSHYKIQMDHSLLICKLLQKGVRVVFSSPNIPKETIRKLMLQPADSPQAALEEAFKMTRKANPMVLFYPQAQRTIPYLT